jgi:AMP nucleosidase
MSIKEHEYIRQTLERYTNSRPEDSCDHILITNFRQYIKRFKEKTKGQSAEGNFRMETHLDIGLDAATKVESNRRTVARKLSSEW